MTRFRTMTVISALVLAGCGQQAENASSESGNSSVNVIAAAEESGNAQGVTQPDGFSIDKVPVSNAALGDFPYISLPEGYAWHKQETRDFDHFLFWTGTALNDVEGKLFMGQVVADKSRTPSAYELRRNLDAVIAQAGGVLVTDSVIPRDIKNTLSDDMTRDKRVGLGDIYNEKATVWVIRRADRAIWIHATPTPNRLAMTILETKPFEATAKLLPASELKAAIDTAGKAVVQINFATDASDILPASRPQIEAIVQLLKQEPGLRLAVNGHTDDTGSADRNRALSDTRAASVRNALIGAGIAADRLTAKGFGAGAPIAPNDTADGKARNRRVELVKL
ncbi:OmpA family protein [Sphingomonas sp. ac-8]|uniref:OmpA family protein n=1 Tax=Sphingomonas sp. ac-8 TaxID=3242977 RepID=UPI003A7F8720